MISLLVTSGCLTVRVFSFVFRYAEAKRLGEQVNSSRQKISRYFYRLIPSVLVCTIFCLFDYFLLQTRSKAKSNSTESVGQCKVFMLLNSLLTLKLWLKVYQL